MSSCRSLCVCPGARSDRVWEKSLKHDAKTTEARSRLRTEGTCIEVSLCFCLSYHHKLTYVDHCRRPQNSVSCSCHATVYNCLLFLSVMCSTCVAYAAELVNEELGNMKDLTDMYTYNGYSRITIIIVGRVQRVSLIKFSRKKRWQRRKLTWAEFVLCCCPPPSSSNCTSSPPSHCCLQIPFSGVLGETWSPSFPVPCSVQCDLTVTVQTSSIFFLVASPLLAILLNIFL